MFEKHRNPNGNYDGVGVMSEVTGLARSEIEAIAAEVKANHAKLASCPWHEFERLITAPPGRERYGCRHCRGTIDASAYHWHEQGRRPQPVSPSKVS